MCGDTIIDSLNEKEKLLEQLIDGKLHVRHSHNPGGHIEPKKGKPRTGAKSKIHGLHAKCQSRGDPVLVKSDFDWTL